MAWRRTGAGPSWTCVREDAGGKREAVERLLARHAPGAAIVLGDDLSDARRLRCGPRRRGAGSRLGSGSRWRSTAGKPAPPEVLARADLVVGSSRDVGRLLGGAGAPARGRVGLTPDRQPGIGGLRGLRDDVDQRLGKSPMRIVSAVATASPLQTSAPWRIAGASLVGSRMYMYTTQRR